MPLLRSLGKLGPACAPATPCHSPRAPNNDQLQAKNLIEADKKHIAAEDYDKLGEVNGRLHSLLPEKEKDSNEMRHFTDIS